MKTWLYFLLGYCCLACQSEPKYPVYKVDLDRPDQVAVSDLFTHVQVIPLETKERSRFLMGELGAKNSYYYILDHSQQLFFCFDGHGKFKYVMDNKPKEEDKKPTKFHSILKPYMYYYHKQWNCYLTFRTEVYTQDKNGNRTTRYAWDFGKYNDDKNLKLFFPPLSPQIVFEIQQEWMKTNSAFALTNTRENENYIYTRLQRIGVDSLAASPYFHLFCYKPTGKCYYFQQFTNEASFAPEIRLENDCILMLLPWEEKEKYENLSLLDEQGRQILASLKEGDNPVVLKWYLKQPVVQ